MRMKRPARRPSPENTIPLINVVFLMLIFFLFAGSIARDDAREVEPPVDIVEDENIRSTGALVIAKDGTLFSKEAATTVEAWLEGARVAEKAEGPLMIAADGSLEADRLEEVLKDLTDRGATDITLITRKGTP